MKNREKNRKVFITGGTGSVGQQLIEVFHQNNDQVLFQFNNSLSLARELENKFNAKAVKINLADEFELFEEDIDIVVNNAGINVGNVISHEVSVSDWEKVLSINLKAPFLIAKKYLPNMKKKKWGRIINISSIYGLRGVDWNLPYNVSKHGLSGLTKSIAKEYAEFGITCNEICPGPIESEMMRRIGIEEASSMGISVDDYLKNYADNIPAKRFAYPEEVAKTALFLASEGAAYINGTSIVVDGGWIA